MPKSTVSTSPIAGETISSTGYESWSKESLSELGCAISSSISNIYGMGEWGADTEILSQETCEYSKILKSINEVETLSNFYKVKWKQKLYSVIRFMYS